MGGSELTERAQHLLKTLVECHIRDGQPVGSRTLARHAGLELSPATVRNVMADLEEMGLVTAPHTSAGRVPTSKGYRLFVDSLLIVNPLQGEEISGLRDQLGEQESLPDLLEAASQMLSGLTQMAGLVMVPRRERFVLRHVEFLALSDDRVLAIFVVNDSEVRNHIIHTHRRFTASELEQAANYLNYEFSGRDLHDAREAVLRAMREAKEEASALMQRAVEAADEALREEQDQADYVLAGQTNLMGFSELADLQVLRQLFEAFSEKRDILHLLDQCLGSQGVQIFIGQESGYDALGGCSIVTAPYQSEGHTVGVLGVIGPTRMAYDRVIPIVDVTAKLLGAALNTRR